MAQNAPTTNSAPGPTLGDINQRLNRAGLPTIPRERLREIISPAVRDRFIRSVFLADQDTESLKFIKGTLRAAGLIDGLSPAQPPLSDDMPPAQAANDSPALGSASCQTPSHGRESASSEDQGWESLHVYGGRAALCFNADITKSGNETIALDAASSTGPKTYDWKQKIRIQLTKAELPVVAAVLLGVRGKCEFKNHGQNNDKGFSLERQDGGKVFVSVFAKGQSAKAVPILAPDVLWVTAIVLQQLQKNCPDIDSMGIITLVRATQSER
ncbi:hypothetical protein [Pseudomonas saliphila]|uniref:hypothetical protein n=1 Tax=Pseudomonas saliphila TaxID=2586906 RepID=UPI0012390987|nr:hypothetical protein [Pseudomonas saliphila]